MPFGDEQIDRFTNEVRQIKDETISQVKELRDDTLKQIRELLNGITVTVNSKDIKPAVSVSSTSSNP